MGILQQSILLRGCQENLTMKLILMVCMALYALGKQPPKCNNQLKSIKKIVSVNKKLSTPLSASTVSNARRNFSKRLVGIPSASFTTNPSTPFVAQNSTILVSSS